VAGCTGAQDLEDGAKVRQNRKDVDRKERYRYGQMPDYIVPPLARFRRELDG